MSATFSSERLTVRVDGTVGAPDLILIPGLSSSPQIWDSTVAHLAGRYRIHRIHVNGFAGAPARANATGPVAAPVAEEIARYITERRLRPPAVVGHSMGGTIGLMLAARHPGLVGKLMVVDILPFTGALYGAPGITSAAVTPIADQVYAEMTSSPLGAYQAQAAATISAMIRTERLRAGPLRDASTSDRAVTSSASRELIVTDLRPELPRITAPLSVLYVTIDDPQMTPEQTDMVYRDAFARASKVTLHRVDRSAHFIMLDQPTVFRTRLEAFLAE